VSPVLRYSLLRLGLFAACLLALSLVAEGLLLVALAALLSMLLSVVLLARPRDQVAAALAERLERRRAVRRPLGADDAEAEDAAADRETPRQRQPRSSSSDSTPG